MATAFNRTFDILSFENEKEDMEIMRNWIDVKCSFNLLYKMTRDGCSAWTFHTKCDNQGPTVTLFQNTHNTVYGGYTSQSWNSPGTGFYADDEKAFLFQLRYKGEKVHKIYPIKHDRTGNAIYNAHDHGPMFGRKEIPYFANVVKPADDRYIFAGDIAMNVYDLKDDNYEKFANSSKEITEIEVYKVDERTIFETTEKPWRNILENTWTQEFFLDEKKSATSYSPSNNVDITCANILLFGEVGSGKSSFVNSVDAVFKGSLSAMANMGSAPHSLTKRFRMYGFSDAESGGNLNFRICDTKGITKSHGLDPMDFCNMLDGHMPDGYLFNSEVQLNENTPGFIRNPCANGKTHIVAIVLDATAVDVFQEDVMQSIRTLQSKATQRELTQVILLTKIDKLCKLLRDDASMTFNLPVVEQTVEKAAQMFGVPPELVFPVINYNKEAVPNEKTDTLTLLALNQMLNFANDRFKNIIAQPGAQAAIQMHHLEDVEEGH